MKKELRALDRIVCRLQDKSAYNHICFEDIGIIEKALKRNDPVRLLVHDNNYGMVEAKSAEDYKYDEWYYPMGYCPICGEQNPIGNNFCGMCGNKLDKFWEEK